MSHISLAKEAVSKYLILAQPDIYKVTLKPFADQEHLLKHILKCSLQFFRNE